MAMSASCAINRFFFARLSALKNLTAKETGMIKTINPTGIERRFGESEILVSQTDKDGYITYCNAFFRDITGFRNEPLVGQPHNCVRHPDMPRSMFKLIWDTLEANKEVFAYLKNLTNNGDHYWAFCHLTPTYDDNGAVSGYHAHRRIPNYTAIKDTIEPLYNKLRDIEVKLGDEDKGMEASSDHFASFLNEKSVSYRNFVLAF